MPNHYTTMMICSPGYGFDYDDFNGRHAETNLCAVVRPMPESVEQVPSIYYADGTTERERLGEDTDWYKWADENWGTKWGTYQVQAIPLGGDSAPILIKFQSAWGPPKILDSIGEWLKNTYDFEDVAFVGFDPFGDSTSIITVEGG